MKNKKILTLVYILILLLLVSLFNGCSTSRDETDDNDEDTEQGQTDDGDEKEPDDGELEPSANQAKLLSLFPDKKNYQWIYDGFAEYNHTMKINAIYEEGNIVLYNISGEVEDVSAGEATGDFGIELQYIFTENSVTEKITRSDKLPHKINELILLKHPLKVGNEWSQDVMINGESKLLKARIDQAGEDESGVEFYKVIYQVEMEGMPNGMYTETRVFKEGVGVERFENTLGAEFEDNFVYILYQATE